jgi:hypothetical protein
MSAPDSGASDYFRLPIVLPPAALREGIERLAEAWIAFSRAWSRRGAIVIS